MQKFQEGDFSSVIEEMTLCDKEKLKTNKGVSVTRGKPKHTFFTHSSGYANIINFFC
jgi:hypothetical protein